MTNVEDKKVNKVPNTPWASAMDGALTMSGLLVGPLVIALIVGTYIDNKQDNGQHLYLYISLMVAFIVTIAGLVGQVLKFNKWQKQLEAIEEKLKDKKE